MSTMRVKNKDGGWDKVPILGSYQAVIAANAAAVNAQNAATHAEVQADSVKKYKALWFDNVAAMKAEPSLTEGAYVNTAGYYAPNDGGGASYLIRTKADSDIADDGSLHELANGLVAELIVENGTVCPEQFGAKADGVADDTEAVQKAIMFASINNLSALFNKNYYVSTPIIISNKGGFRLLANNNNSGVYKHVKILAPNGFLIFKECMFVDIDGFAFSDTNSKPIRFIEKGSRWINIRACKINHADVGIDCEYLYYSSIKDCLFYNNNIGINCGKDGEHAGSITIDNCHFLQCDTDYYINTNSDINISNCTGENQGKIMYSNNAAVSVKDCYFGDGMNYGFDVHNSRLFLSNMTQRFVSRNYVINLVNSEAYLNNVVIDDENNNAPFVLDEASNIYLSNVKNLGHAQLSTPQTFIMLPRNKNYITSIDTDYVVPNWGNAKTIPTVTGKNYMGGDIVNYTSDGVNLWGIKINYSVPKAGWYLFHLSGEFDEDGFYFKADALAPNNKFCRGISEHLWIKHKNEQNYTINESGTVIYPFLKKRPNTVITVPFYIAEGNLASAIVCHSSEPIVYNCTINFTGITDFTSCFDIPCFD